jgi:Molybdopterin-guanine dinucleotide biosynthesis protein A
MAVDGLILAGGCGRRLGGGGKALITWRGRRFLDWTAEALRPQVARLLLSVPDTDPRLDGPADLQVEDGDWQQAGPMAGLLAGCRASTADWLAYAPVDALRLPPDLVTRLLAAAEGRVGAYVRAGGQVQPTCGLLQPTCASALEQSLRRDQRALMPLLDTLGAAIVDWPADAWIWSVNTPQELAALPA